MRYEGREAETSDGAPENFILAKYPLREIVSTREIGLTAYTTHALRYRWRRFISRERFRSRKDRIKRVVLQEDVRLMCQVNLNAYSRGVQF